MLTAILFVIGMVLIAGVMAFFGFGEVVGAITGSNLYYIAGAVIVQIIILLLLAARIKVVSSKFGSNVSFINAFKITMSAIAISMLTPVAKIGGEPLKIYLLKRRGISGSDATAVVAVDTLSELTSSLLVVLLIFLVFAKEVPGNIFSSFIVFLAIVTAVIVGLLRVLTDPKLMRRIVNWSSRKIARFTHVGKKDYAKLFYGAFTLVIKDAKIMTGAFSMSVVMKILEFGRMWLVFASIGVFLPADIIVILWAVILVLYLVPWLPGSLGLVEFFGAGLLVFFGLTASTAAGGILIDRFISFWFVLIFGLLVGTTVKRKKKRN